MRGREAFVEAAVAFAKQMFPNGISFRFVSVVAEGAEVAVQSISDTIAHNRKHYSNRYHHYFRFDGDKIALARDNCDTNYVGEILLT